eukprot:3755450-Amphidinium_carterae.2
MQQRSQLGFVIVLAPQAALTSTTPLRCSILDWKSHRTLKQAFTLVSDQCTWPPRCIMWVPCAWQLADPLTKLDKSLRARCSYAVTFTMSLIPNSFDHPDEWRCDPFTDPICYAMRATTELSKLVQPKRKLWP